MKHSQALFLAVISLVGTKGVGQPQDMAKSLPTAYVNRFDAVADAALLAMRARAGEVKIGRVAVVAYFEGDTLQSWSSKMIVVGKYKDAPTDADKVEPLGDCICQSS